MNSRLLKKYRLQAYATVNLLVVTRCVHTLRCASNFYEGENIRYVCYLFHRL